MIIIGGELLREQLIVKKEPYFFYAQLTMPELYFSLGGKHNIWNCSSPSEKVTVTSQNRTITQISESNNDTIELRKPVYALHELVDPISLS